MYQAKLSGKNRCHVFDDALDRLVRGQHEGLERIRLAMAREEFELVYQPRVNLRTGQVVGAEALIRWRHPERGLLGPELFLPVLEGHAQSILLGEWVLDTALSQIEAWKAAGLGLPVSVNVDALQLQQPDFVSRLRGQLAAHPGVTAGDLELEVRETSALGDMAQASRVMLACRDLGIDFALDDFGAGYSSLTYLRRLPARHLKIDQSFVRGMLDDAEDLAILEGILGLASAFHRRAIAEGVETVAHGEMLLRLGCELAQGYGIAPPMTAEAIPGWLAGWRPAPSWRNLPPLSRDDRPILFAAVEHRAWISALTDYLRGQLEAPPLEPERCRLADWLDREGQARYGGQAAFQGVARLHREICAGASALLAHKGQGRGPVALAGLDELHRLRDALLERVLALLGAEGPGQA
jgi:EAL domain-containing protein (putative c-di-GMP-specific phosphodiesterase class I)